MRGRPKCLSGWFPVGNNSGLLKTQREDFPGGAVDRNPPAMLNGLTAEFFTALILGAARSQWGLWAGPVVTGLEKEMWESGSQRQGLQTCNNSKIS